MLTILIFIYFRKDVRAQIHPLSWFIFPRKVVTSEQSKRQRKSIGIWVMTDAAKGFDDCEKKELPVTWFNCYALQFLCFTINYSVRQRTELSSIYGLNYDPNKETFDGAKMKYHELTKTEFFN